MPGNIGQFLETNQDLLLQDLFEWLSIPSISTLPEHKEDIRRAADWMVDYLKAIGLEKVDKFETEMHPMVFGQTAIDLSRPTILIYGHYDVQPPDPLAEWNTPPFEPTVRDGKLYARGATDNKGQIFAHVIALKYLLSSGQDLPVNVKMLVEGEEEVGSVSAERFVEDHKEMLAADLAVLSDGTMIKKGLPTIYYGMRGLMYMEVEVTALKHDVHSGLFGGLVDNPAMVLAQMISHLKDRDGKVLVPGFYDDVVEPTEEERKMYQKLPFDPEVTKENTGAKELFTEEGYSDVESGSLRPTLDVNGVWGGFAGEGSKTIIPGHASAKISSRLVPNQYPDEIYRKIKKYLEEIAPPTVEVSTHEHVGVPAYAAELDALGMEEAKAAMKEAFGRDPVLKRVGGVIGMVYYFKDLLGIDTLMLDLGWPDDNLHAPNEKIEVENIFRGAKMSVRLQRSLSDRS